jgi:hypothetical protein
MAGGAIGKGAGRGNACRVCGGEVGEKGIGCYAGGAGDDDKRRAEKAFGRICRNCREV